MGVEESLHHEEFTFSPQLVSQSVLEGVAGETSGYAMARQDSDYFPLPNDQEGERAPCIEDQLKGGVDDEVDNEEGDEDDEDDEEAAECYQQESAWEEPLPFEALSDSLDRGSPTSSPPQEWSDDRFLQSHFPSGNVHVETFQVI